MAPTRRRLLQLGATAAAVGAIPARSLAQGLSPEAQSAQSLAAQSLAAQSLASQIMASHAPWGLSAPTPSFSGAAAPVAPRPGAWPSRRVALHNLHTGESLDTVYWENGRYVPGAMLAVNHVLRDYRNGEQHQMHPGLMDLLDTLSSRVGARGPFQVISGYRSPATNAMLHERSGQVANHSLHMQGMAIDIRAPGVDLSHLHTAALSLGRGGVGYYPTSDFVHVDVGPVRQWAGA